MKLLIRIFLFAFLPISIAAGNLYASPLVMTDELYDEFTNDETFCLSERVLNKTWELIKSSLSKQKYQEVLKQQREWIKSGRNSAANKYASSMTPVEAFTKVNIDRSNELAIYLNPQIVAGEYIYLGREGNMKVKLVQDNNYEVEIFTMAGQNICEASGHVSYSNNGWNMPDDYFYILFLKDKAIVLPLNDSFCGLNATIEGEYKLQK